ncbi:MAG TPA: STAS/SEC14 domain-containing protein [Hanamia sp.]|jgi:SpoIIAA-like|nr:STAS/SEC14 domain-containing protein [Hanamia sp.]
MIEVIQGLPAKVAAFRATGSVTEDDYIKVVNPLCDKVYKEFGKINYLMDIDTPLSNYSAGAWIKDALLGFIYFTDWRKIAIVSPKKGIKDFTDFFGKLIPGKSKGFMSEDLDQAIRWVSE